jgi:Fic family protein
MTRPAAPPVYEDHLAKLVLDKRKAKAIHTLRALARTLPYEHWDAMRQRPVPEPFTPEDLWLTVKHDRHLARVDLALRDRTGLPLHYVAVPQLQAALTVIDEKAIALAELVNHSAEPGRDKVLHEAMIEEPFCSAGLEGATTTRELALKMIESRRPPAALEERRVINAVEAMRFVHAHGSESLTPLMIQAINRHFIHDLPAAPDQTAGTRQATLDALCAFANGDDRLHPVLRAILLHFKLAHDAPFAAANDATARALFYWSAAHSGYWLLDYISISAVIRRTRSQYDMAFLHVESDESDVTYFLLHQLDAVTQALEDFEVWLRRALKEQDLLAAGLSMLEQRLNARQVPLMQHAIKHPGGGYTSAQHMWHHGVSYLTARSDLEELTKMGLLKKTKLGAKSMYLVPSDLLQRLARTPPQNQ